MSRFVLAAALVLGLAACKQGKGDHCQVNADCSGNLVCNGDGICSSGAMLGIDAEVPNMDGGVDARPVDARPLDAPPDQ